jgi:hypothetical protein
VTSAWIRPILLAWVFVIVTLAFPMIGLYKEIPLFLLFLAIYAVRRFVGESVERARCDEASNRSPLG